MDTIFSGNLSARILLTILTAGYGLIPALADLNKTHAKNPLWTPHARFHVVWQVCSYVGLALIGLGLIWIRAAQFMSGDSILRHRSQRLYTEDFSKRFSR
jgi:hypothetical protein